MTDAELDQRARDIQAEISAMATKARRSIGQRFRWVAQNNERMFYRRWENLDRIEYLRGQLLQFRVLGRTL